MARNFKVVELMGDYSSAIPFIIKKTGETSTEFHMDPNAEKLLRDIKKPVAPLVICGPYRSGKSYFLSRMLSSMAEFRLGHTTDPCTHGIWMGTSVLECEEFVVVLFDTEGTDAHGATAECDLNILVLSILMSSLLVYNSKNVPERSDLEKMKNFTKLAETLVIHANHETADLTDFRHHFPDFLWLLRDVSVSPVNRSGKRVTPTEYLKKVVLAPNPSSAYRDVNQVKFCIMQYFPKIECAMLPIPTSDNEVLNNMHLPETQNNLTKEFSNSLEETVSLVLEMIQVKKMYNSNVSPDGSILADVIKEYCKAINTPGVIPALNTSWENVVSAHLAAKTKELVMEYERKLEAEVHDKLPMEELELRKIHTRIFNELQGQLECEADRLLPLMEEVADKKNKILKSLETEIVKIENDKVVGGIFHKFIANNEKESNIYCEHIFENIFRPFKERLDSALQNADDYTDDAIDSCVKELFTDYYEQSKGPAKEEVFDEKKKAFFDCYKDMVMAQDMAKKKLEKLEDERRNVSSLLEAIADLQLKLEQEKIKKRQLCEVYDKKMKQYEHVKQHQLEIEHNKAKDLKDLQMKDAEIMSMEKTKEIEEKTKRAIAGEKHKQEQVMSKEAETPKDLLERLQEKVKGLKVSDLWGPIKKSLTNFFGYSYSPPSFYYTSELR